MLRVQIKEQEAEFQGTSPTNFVVVAQNYYLKKTHRTVVGGNMRKVWLKESQEQWKYKSVKMVKKIGQSETL